MADGHMPDAAREPLDYASPSRRRWFALPSHVMRGFVASIVFLFPTFLAMLPDLHNRNPFMPFWAASAVVATLFVLPVWRDARQPAAGRGFALASLVLWLMCLTVGGLAAFQRYHGEDPHVTTR